MIDLSRLVTAKQRAASDAARDLEEARTAALAYLRDSDWMVIRACEGGPAVPAGVGRRRAECRALLSAE